MEKGELRIESVEDLKNVLKEYEIHTKVVEDQIEICKKDHADLRLEMNSLMNENRDLYKRLKMASEGALNRIDRPPLETQEAVENLKQQLSLALEEKDTMEALWRSSVQDADTLKETLQEYQSGKKLSLLQSKLNEVQKDYTEAIQILEKKQNTLKAENDQLNVKCKFLEGQLKEVNSQIKSVNEKNFILNNSLKECSEWERQSKSKCLALEAKLIELERAYQADKVKYARVGEYEKAEASLRERLEESQRTGNEMQTALEHCHEHKQELLRQVAANRTKVEEALALVEEANRDREVAVARELAATEETKKLRAEMEKLVDEAGRRVASEEANLKRQFDEQLAVVKDQLVIVEQERNRKRVEVEQLQKECEKLQNSLSQTQAAGTDQTDRLMRRVGSAETLCEGLRCENEALREALDKLEDKCKRKSQQRQKLESEIHRLMKDTQYYQQELAMSEQKADILSSQLQTTSLDLAQLQSNTILHRASTVGAEPRVSLTSTLELLKKQNDSFGQMNDRWKNEMTTVIAKFEELRKTKKENKVRFNRENTGDKK